MEINEDHFFIYALSKMLTFMIIWKARLLLINVIYRLNSSSNYRLCYEYGKDTLTFFNIQLSIIDIFPSAVDK